MKTKKEGQVTLFIILGIVLLIIMALLFYLVNYVKEKRRTEVTEIEKTPFDISPVREYVMACLDRTTKDGLLLLGKQGGYIYKSQGGTLVDYSDNAEGVYFVNYNNYKVSYGIYPPRYKVGNFFPEAWEYPWINFPHEDGDLDKEYSFEGIFGKNGMPPLNEIDGAHSIHIQLVNFIKNNIDSCLDDFSVFENFEIEKSGKDVFVNIAREDLAIHLQYKLRIKNKVSGEETEIVDFYLNPEIRLYRIYSFVDNLVNKDITDIGFDIKSTSSGYISVDVWSNIYDNDDIIIVKDTKSLIKARPLEFIFARHNRLPALYYIESPLQRTFTISEELTKADIEANLRAIDPDEDAITADSFSFDPDGDITLPYTFESYGYPMYRCRQDGYYNVKVSVRDDEGLIDYQIVEVPCYG